MTIMREYFLLLLSELLYMNVLNNI